MGILRDTDDDGLDLGSTPDESAGSLLTASPPDSTGPYAGGGVPPQAAPAQATPTQAAPQPGPPQAPPQPAPAQAVPPAAAPAAPTPGASGHSELERRREALAAQVAELHWDLGGLAYEMAIRDHFRLDVLVRRAAMLQERDAELAEVERLLRMEQDGVAGNCPQCTAPHSRGAVFCWQCGTALMERLPSSSASTDE
jgi:hypothetical protein